jgi:hypothetical protein
MIGKARSTGAAPSTSSPSASIAYTAARFDEEALDNPKLGHGFFTYAVVEGLQGQGRACGKEAGLDQGSRRLRGHARRGAGEGHVSFTPNE